MIDTVSIVLLSINVTTLLGVGGVLVQLAGLKLGYEDHERRIKKLEVKHG